MGFFILIVSVLLVSRMVMYTLPQYTALLKEEYSHEHAWVTSERMLHMIEDERYVVNLTKANQTFERMESLASGVFMPGVGAILTEYPVVVTYQNDTGIYGELVFNKTGDSTKDEPVVFAVWDSNPSRAGYDALNLTLPSGVTIYNLTEGNWTIIPSTGDPNANYTIKRIDPYGGFVVLERTLARARVGIKDTPNAVRVSRYTTHNGFVARLDVYYAGGI